MTRDSHELDSTRLAAKAVAGRVLAQSPSDRDAIARRGVIRRSMSIGAWVWPAFALTDVYMAVVLYPGAPLWLFLLYRIVVELLIVGIYLQARKPGAPIARLERWHNVMYVLSALCIALMAIDLGGPGSPYMHGISIVCVVRAAVCPEPWRRSSKTFVLLAAVFPLVMTIVPLISPAVRSDWLSRPSLALFAANYIFVISAAVVGMISGHLVWAAQQQVYKARRLGRYRLEAQLGQGGMGEVWLAWDGALRRNIALKILRTDGIASPDSVARFEREAQSASRLRVPHTIQVYDFGASDDGVYYIAMEYLPGADLRRLVERQGPMSAARAIHFIRQACLSLEEAHDAGIIHRDIKPQNLFATRVGDEYDFAKLLDFGIAAVKDERAGDETRSGVVRGTPAFLAPELWHGTTADSRSDIYALGATMYYLLTGEVPFAPGEIDRALHGDAPIAPSARTQHPVPNGLDAVVLRCLTKSPADRFQSACDLRNALDRLPVERWVTAEARRFWREVGPAAIEPVELTSQAMA